MTIFYFAYGSNMSAAQMAQRCPGAIAHDPARLDGFVLAFDRYSERWQGYVADIVDRSQGQTWGVLWEVTEAHLQSLDRYEGVATGAYRRITVNVVDGAGAVVEAVAYRVVSPVPPGPPSTAYLQALIDGAQEHHLPGWYVTYLRNIGAPSAPG